MRKRKEGKSARKNIIENNKINGKKNFHEDYEGTKVFVKHERKDRAKYKRYGHLRNSPIVIK